MKHAPQAIEVKTAMKKFYHNHQSAILKTAVGVAVIGATYYIGKSRGELTVEVFLHNKNEIIPMSTKKIAESMSK